jgi:YidC/Oxa1 family membrane protein insertase
MMHTIDTILTPLTWGVSGILAMWHWLFSHLFGANSGITWVLSIVGLVVVIRTILIPLFVKQIRASRNMALIQPKMKELQKKYGDDRERFAQETMKLYKESGTNPFSSCLPILAQSPILYSLFRVLNEASHGKSLGHWMTQSLVDSLNNAQIFGAEISETFLRASTTNVKILAVVLIVAMTGMMFFTQLQLMRRNMPKEALTGQFAQQQKIILYLFPVAFAVGGISFPIGVLVYWLTTNIWTAGQQYVVIKNNPTPGTQAYDEYVAKHGHPPNASRKVRKEAAEKLAELEVELSRDDGPPPPPARVQPKKSTRGQRRGASPVTKAGRPPSPSDTSKSDESAIPEK